jgi:hypothetical protein
MSGSAEREKRIFLVLSSSVRDFLQIKRARVANFHILHPQLGNNQMMVTLFEDVDQDVCYFSGFFHLSLVILQWLIYRLALRFTAFEQHHRLSHRA